jgi:hypothetical protein
MITYGSLDQVSPLALTEQELQQFNEQGYIGPFNLFHPAQTEIVLNNCGKYPNLLLPSLKSRHTVVREMAKTAMHPRIIEKVVSILGQDVLLWGSIIINQKAIGKHPIHVDAEHVAWEGITVWLGMKNVISGASFSIIPGSHLFDISPQELKEKQGLDTKDDTAVLEAAKKINPDSKLLYLDITDGQFVIFSGKLWHGTKNTTATPRSSFIFQYTRPDSEVRIPKTFAIPIKTWYKKAPVCLLVHGQDKFHVNKTIDIDQIDERKNFIKGIFTYLPINMIHKIREEIKVRFMKRKMIRS